MPYRKRWAAFATLISLGLVTTLAACGGGGSTASGPVNITFWSFNQQITEQADLFNKSHPNIHVTALKQASGAAYYSKILAGVKANDAPDVALVEYGEVPEFVSKGALTDLTTYGANDVKDQFASSAWNEEVFNNGVYGYPQDTGPMGFYYNAATFKKAGITAPPATWDEFATDAAKIHALGPDNYIVAFTPGQPAQFQAYMWQAGAIWFTTQGSSWVINTNSAKSQQVAGFWDNLIAKGLVDTAATNGDFQGGWNSGLNKGTIAGWIAPVWGQGVIPGSAADQKGNWAVAEMPQWVAGQHASAFWGGSGISVVASSKHPKEAAAFAQWYLTNTDSLKIGVDEIGWFPSNKAANVTASTATNPYFAGTTPGGQVVDQIFVTASNSIDATWQFPPNYDTVNTDQQNAFNQALANHQTLVSQLPALQQQIIQDLTNQNISAKAGS